ncbi:hypothetical protein ACIP9H_29490 [Streptomyces sp. NPDC088732]|uniref:hypothetical protein n=1 Tax=Streptomyces sp. NPDC088732 TaxID=3365879 RepID=UPI003817E7CE
MSPTLVELAARDQAAAHVRDFLAQGIPVLFVDLAPGGQCSWCDCPITPAVPNPDMDHACGGCPTTAMAELKVYPPLPGDKTVPVCDAHYEDALAFVAQLLAGGRA